MLGKNEGDRKNRKGAREKVFQSNRAQESAEKGELGLQPFV